MWSSVGLTKEGSLTVLIYIISTHNVNETVVYLVHGTVREMYVPDRIRGTVYETTHENGGFIIDVFNSESFQINKFHSNCHDLRLKYGSPQTKV